MELPLKHSVLLSKQKTASNMFSAAPLALGAVDHVNEAITWTVDDDELAKNTFTFSSAPAGETVQVAMFI